MDSMQRRREAQYAMPMEQQLMHAVDLRFEAEEEFKRQIVFSLKDLIKKLAECDPSNARTTLDLTQQQLGGIINKLNDKHIISTTEASNIANIVRDSNLLRRPQPDLPTPPATPEPPESQVLPPAPPAVTPASPVLTPAPQAVTPAVQPKPVSIVNPPGKPSTGRNDAYTRPGSRPPPPGPGGRRTRRKGKSKRIV